jgi:hypothetical protein
MEPCTGAQSAFAVKAFYKNGDSFVIAPREFRREFGIHRNRAVPLRPGFETCWQQNGDSGIRPSVAEPEKTVVAKSLDSVTHPTYVTGIQLAC